MDQENLLNQLYPDFVVRLRRLYVDFFNLHQMKLRITQGLRTFEEQNALYAKGRTAPGSIVTNAKGGSSFHNYGIAADHCFAGQHPYLEHLAPALAQPYWSEYGRFAKAHGLAWGGDFKSLVDRPHVEITYGLTLGQVKELYLQGGIVGVWTRFDQIRGVRPGSEWADKRKLTDPYGPLTLKT